MHSHNGKRTAVISGIWLLLACPALAQDGSVTQAPVENAPPAVPNDHGRRHALILVGLAGDEQHEKRFGAHAAVWVEWLATIGTAREQIQVLGGHDAAQPSDRAAIEKAVHDLQQRLTPEDSLWVFFLGHADYDGEHARFHMPGPDLRAVDFADLFQNVRCREQIIWLTMSSSGWFLEPLSQPARIVVAATQAEAEPNETEFPDALSEAMQLPPGELDADQDGTVSVLELFAATVDRVEAKYAADQRAPTEHAMIDDDGDGRGTPVEAIREQMSRARAEDSPFPLSSSQQNRLDGQLAATTRLQTISQPPPVPLPSASGRDEAEVNSEHEVISP